MIFGVVGGVNEATKNKEARRRNGGMRGRRKHKGQAFGKYKEGITHEEKSLAMCQYDSTLPLSL